MLHDLEHSCCSVKKDYFLVALYTQRQFWKRKLKQICIFVISHLSTGRFYVILKTSPLKKPNKYCLVLVY